MGDTDLQTVGIGWDIQVRKHNYKVVFDLQLL